MILLHFKNYANSGTDWTIVYDSTWDGPLER